MSDHEIKIDQQALLRAAQPQLDALQEDLDSRIQAAIRGVRDEMSGQPADVVFAKLTERLNEQVSGLQLNDDSLREVAAEIEAGTLED